MKQLRPYQQQAIDECWNALKANDDPVLLMASVGSGKSVMISEILLRIEHANKRALCIVNNSELVRNNSQTYNAQGGNASVYSASLNSKCIDNNIIFATPQTLINAINKKKKIANIKFNLIVIDEAHQINYTNHQNTFMRILRHYKTEYPEMRVLGATGTNFRFKGEQIVGPKCLFKTQVGNITTAQLINDNYLVKPEYQIDQNMVIDFSRIKLNKMGQFSGKQLETVVERNHRLTAEILVYLQHIMEQQNRFGCFIFCCSKKHCEEAASVLPPEQTAIITGETHEKDRQIILDKARKGEIKYLVNIQVLTIGIDVPGYDTLLFLRPTESLVLAVQMIGRVLRLYPEKKAALILDCAGNIERHSDWDDPMIIDAIKQIAKQKNLAPVFECQECGHLNTENARRCTAIIDSKRCDFYFTFKDCHTCNRKNDITARYCRWCEEELLDPNRHLSNKILNPGQIIVEVCDSNFTYDNKFIALYTYENMGAQLAIKEEYHPVKSDKAKNVFYANFVRLHCAKPSSWYMRLQNPKALNELAAQAYKPNKLLLQWKENEWLIKKKYFDGVS